LFTMFKIIPVTQCPNVFLAIPFQNYRIHLLLEAADKVLNNMTWPTITRCFFLLFLLLESGSHWNTHEYPIRIFLFSTVLANNISPKLKLVVCITRVVRSLLNFLTPFSNAHTIALFLIALTLSSLHVTRANELDSIQESVSLFPSFPVLFFNALLLL
jgi:hypothetical protein